MPRERRVVIVESLLTPTQFRETVCEVGVFLTYVYPIVLPRSLLWSFSSTLQKVDPWEQILGRYQR